MEKVKSIVNSWWFQAAATGCTGALLLAYGHTLYGGIALGWAACKVFDYLKS